MSDVILETKDRIARIELARLDKKNALTGAMYRAMQKALEDADADAGVRAILVHGARDCFTAGNSCAGTVEKDNAREAWIYVPKGTCQRIAGGTTDAPK